MDRLPRPLGGHRRGGQGHLQSRGGGGPPGGPAHPSGQALGEGPAPARRVGADLRQREAAGHRRGGRASATRKLHRGGTAPPGVDGGGGRRRLPSQRRTAVRHDRAAGAGRDRGLARRRILRREHDLPGRAGQSVDFKDRGPGGDPGRQHRLRLLGHGPADPDLHQCLPHLHDLGDPDHAALPAEPRGASQPWVGARRGHPRARGIDPERAISGGHVHGQQAVPAHGRGHHAGVAGSTARTGHRPLGPAAVLPHDRKGPAQRARLSRHLLPDLRGRRCYPRRRRLQPAWAHGRRQRAGAGLRDLRGAESGAPP